MALREPTGVKSGLWNLVSYQASDSVSLTIKLYRAVVRTKNLCGVSTQSLSHGMCLIPVAIIIVIVVRELLPGN